MCGEVPMPAGDAAKGRRAEPLRDGGAREQMMVVVVGWRLVVVGRAAVWCCVRYGSVCVVWLCGCVWAVGVNGACERSQLCATRAGRAAGCFGESQLTACLWPSVCVGLLATLTFCRCCPLVPLPCPSRRCIVSPSLSRATLSCCDACNAWAAVFIGLSVLNE